MKMTGARRTWGCVVILWASAAAADRHCAPSSEQYYAARLAVLEAEPNAEPQVNQAVASLGSALTEAAICGCPEIREVLDDLYVRVSKPEMTTETVRSAILAAQFTVDTAISTCHS